MMQGEFQIAWEVMKWPLAACLVLPPLLVYLGLHVVEREVIFVDLALAQVATLGTCIALLLGHHFTDQITFWISLGVTFLGAAFFSWSRGSRKHRVPQEAIIGITFVVAAAGVTSRCMLSAYQTVTHLVWRSTLRLVGYPLSARWSRSRTASGDEGAAPLPMLVVATGIEAICCNCASSACACDRCTPPPATMIGLRAAASQSAASAMRAGSATTPSSG